jgi:hypothetical protein
LVLSENNLNDCKLKISIFMIPETTIGRGLEPLDARIEG